MVQSCDFLIVGAGMAGASLGYELSAHGQVVVLERESAPGYHATGRSAAVFAPSYGNSLARRLTRASRPLFEAPPAGFAEHRLITPRGVLYIAVPGEETALEELAGQLSAAGARGEILDPPQMAARVPVLRADRLARGLFDATAMDIDVHGLHQGYVAGLRRAGGALMLNAEVGEIGRANGGWRVATRTETFQAPVLVNAAGAWGDEIARLAGVAPLGLTPMRRTVASIDPPEGVDPAPWPMVVAVSENLYFKPDAGRILVSPAEETESPPCDAQAEEMDIAIAMDRLGQVTSLAPRRIGHKWAGLRTFAPDRVPVAGYDGEAAGFFWLVGQGGTGIQMAPALACVASALVRNKALPEDIAGHGIAAAALSPTRASLCRASGRRFPHRY